MAGFFDSLTGAFDQLTGNRFNPSAQYQQPQLPPTYDLRASQGEAYGPVNPKFGLPQFQGQTLGSNTGPGGGGGGQQQQQQPQGPGGQPQQGPNQDALGAIDSLYNSTIGAIGGIQSGLQGEQQSEIQKVQQGQQSTQKSLQSTQQDRQANIETRKGQARGQESSALEQLRQLYGDAQSQQVAQLSAAGISSSSAAEALGAYLTRDQAQRVSGVVQQTGDVMSGLDTEAKSVNDWYTQSTTELQQDTQGKVDQINRDFAQRVGQLDQIRGQSAVARQSQRADLFNQYQQQLSDLNNYSQQAAYSLQLWQQQQQNNLSQARQAFGNINQQQVQNLNQQGANVTGTPIVDQNGNIVGYSNAKANFLANNFNPQQQQNSVIQPTQAGGAPVGQQSNIRSLF